VADSSWPLFGEVARLLRLRLLLSGLDGRRPAARSYPTRWGYETLMCEVSDSLHLRRFCLTPLDEEVPDESTVRKLDPPAGCGPRASGRSPARPGAHIISGRASPGSKRTQRRLARYRVGVEGRISNRKRRHGLRRSRLKGGPGERTSGRLGGVRLQRRDVTDGTPQPSTSRSTEDSKAKPKEQLLPPPSKPADTGVYPGEVANGAPTTG
jgi:hypothetical protein